MCRQLKGGGMEITMVEMYIKFRSELLDSCVPFWLENGVDTAYGVVLNCFDRTGKVYSQDKSCIDLH